MYDREDYNDYDREISLDELSKEVDEEHDMMSEEEKYCRIRDCEPTFLQFALSSMNHQKMKKAIINEYTYKIKMIE